jgi:hypothetical protein
MGIVAKDSGDSFERELPPAGFQDAVCSKIFDLGKQLSDYQGQQKLQHKVLFVWELAATMSTGEYAGKRFVVHREYTLSLHEKASLRKDLEGWKGKDIPEEVARQGIDLEKMLKVPCTVQINHQTSRSGNEYAKVVSVAPARHEAPMLFPELPDDWCPTWIADKMAEAVADDRMEAGEVGKAKEDEMIF